MKTLTIELDLVCPSTNGFWTVYQGRKNLSKKGREFKEYVESWLMNYRKQSFKDKRIRVDYEFYFKGKRKRDTDNYIKPTQDCLSGNLFDDDESIDHVTAKRFYHAEEYKTIITITELEKTPSTS